MPSIGSAFTPATPASFGRRCLAQRGRSSLDTRGQRLPITQPDYKDSLRQVTRARMSYS
jgi:hypothetical protein